MNHQFLFIAVVALLAFGAGLLINTPAEESVSSQPTLANKVGGKKNSMPYKIRLNRGWVPSTQQKQA